MSIDYRSFSTGGSRAESAAGSPNARWWELDGQQAADGISTTLTRMRDNQTLRHTQWVISARLYGNLAPTSLAGVSFSKLATTQPALRDRVSYNVIQSVVDTIVSKIAKNRPRPLFLTSGGDYRQQRRAKGLNTFCDGLFYENGTHKLGATVFRDAAVWGDGFIHVFTRNGRVCHERVLPSELFVDDVEATYGEPRQLHRIKMIDRHVLAEAFPDHADVIMSANAARTEDTSRGNVADVLLVRESWHLPSGPEADDGRHVISIDGVLLTELEPWRHNFFPFARVQWSPRLFGYWGQGLAEQLMNLQMEINKLLWVIQRSFHLGASFKVFVENGSKIVKEHINNDVGTIINYTGSPPAYVSPPLVQPEVFGHLQTLVSKAYEQAGISQLSAGSMKPAGLNSGRALREMVDIESDRFAIVGRAYEQLFLDVARLSIELVKELAEDGDYEVTTPGRGAIARIKWSEVDLDADDYVMQMFPVSSLPNDPAGRLQTVQEYAQAGFLSPRQARRLLDFPDLDQVESLANAAEEYLVSVLDAIVDDGIYTAPEPFDDLALARELALEYYARGKSTGLEEERLELLRRFLAQLDALENPPAPEQPSPDELVPAESTGPAPIGPPPGGPSELMQALLAAGGTAAPAAPPMPRRPSELVAQ
jgi:hypothetical protein